MRSPSLRILALVICSIFLCSLSVSAELVIKSSQLPTIGFGHSCHPSVDEFSITTMAANFTCPYTAGDAPLTVKFYDVSYGFPNYYEWDFGDGNTSNEKNPVYTYLIPGVYTVTHNIYQNVSYETPMSEFNLTGKGQMTDFQWESKEVKPNFITVYEPGTGVFPRVPKGWRPEGAKSVKMPSGLDGAVGTASLKANEITIINSSGTGNTLERGYTDTLSVNGAYYLVHSIPYNTAF